MTAVPRLTVVVEFRNVSFSYNGHLALRNITFTARAAGIDLAHPQHHQDDRKAATRNHARKTAVSERRHMRVSHTDMDAHGMS